MQGELAESSGLLVRAPRQLISRHAFEHAPGRVGFLVEFIQQTVNQCHGSLLSGDQAAGAPCGFMCTSIQDVPNLSRSIAKREAKKVSCIGMKSCPSSDKCP